MLLLLESLQARSHKKYEINVETSSSKVDCGGVFTCMFADFVTKDCEPVFNQTHITQCRQRIALSIMKNCAIE